MVTHHAFQEIRVPVMTSHVMGHAHNTGSLGPTYVLGLRCSVLQPMPCCKYIIAPHRRQACEHEDHIGVHSGSTHLQLSRSFFCVAACLTSLRACSSPHIIKHLGAISTNTESIGVASVWLYNMPVGDLCDAQYHQHSPPSSHHDSTMYSTHLFLHPHVVLLTPPIIPCMLTWHWKGQATHQAFCTSPRLC